LESDHLEDLVVEGWIILKLIFKKWDREACNGLLQIRVGTMWRALANMQLQVPAEYLLDSKEEMCSTDLTLAGPCIIIQFK
jgi:hypothetical protein